MYNIFIYDHFISRRYYMERYNVRDISVEGDLINRNMVVDGILYDYGGERMV